MAHELDSKQRELPKKKALRPQIKLYITVSRLYFEQRATDRRLLTNSPPTSRQNAT